MEYTIDCYFRMKWYDPRLMYANSSWKHVEDITLHYDLVNKVWTPDAFFRNAKDAKSHMITMPNRLVRIHPEGRALFSQRPNAPTRVSYEAAEVSARQPDLRY